MRPATTVSVDRDIADLIPEFFAHRKREIEQIRSALVRGDFAAVRRIAHGLKGVGGAFGFDAVSQTGAALLQAAEAADAAAIGRLAVELETYLAGVHVTYV